MKPAPGQIKGERYSNLKWNPLKPINFYVKQDSSLTDRYTETEYFTCTCIWWKQSAGGLVATKRHPPRRRIDYIYKLGWIGYRTSLYCETMRWGRKLLNGGSSISPLVINCDHVGITDASVGSSGLPLCISNSRARAGGFVWKCVHCQYGNYLLLYDIVARKLYLYKKTTCLPGLGVFSIVVVTLFACTAIWNRTSQSTLVGD